MVIEAPSPWVHSNVGVLIRERAEGLPVMTSEYSVGNHVA